MADYGHDLLFGYFCPPASASAHELVELARFAEALGLDLLGVQDHPYHPRLLDMWTLLSVLGAETERIRLVPDVLNLPLRPPAVLARAAATLDVLSGGRLELGLGSGASAGAIAAFGGPERSPRQSVDALAEAITVLRALWTPGPPVDFHGRHYILRGAQPGPFPLHPIGVWLGAYKNRMLRLTGRTADGWIPTLSYAPPEELGAMSRVIDDAADGAGRVPSAIRRIYNIAGRFGPLERGFLDGPPELWIAQLTELVLEYGFSGFLLDPGNGVTGALETFAVEVAPGVREAVAAIRGGEPALVAIEESDAKVSATPISVTSSLSSAPHSRLLDEADRPHYDAPNDGRTTPSGEAGAQTLVQVHNHLREELASIQAAAQAVAEGRLEPEEARSLINRLTVRQNYWTLGSFCAQYCRVVTVHHTIEDRHMFPALYREDEALSAVLNRLGDEHEIIAEVLERFDRGLAAMMSEPAAIRDVRRLADELSDALLSHLAYEERELLGPLSRSAIVV